MSGPVDDFDDDLREFDEEDGDDECALNFETGQCGHAGSEWCDFSCRWRNTAHFAGNPGFKPKRKRTGANHDRTG